MTRWLADRLNTDPGHIRGRIMWLLWWRYALRLWMAYRRATCREHVPVSVRIGLMSEFQDGGRGRQQVRCGYCSVVIAEYP